MALQSKLFRGDSKLEAAAVSDPAHIMIGAKGDHVRKIQQALTILDGADIDHDGAYGHKTAAAVLAYKQKRNIINRTYQTKADNIVGKMTIAALDREMLKREQPQPTSPVCTLYPLGYCRRPSKMATVKTMLVSATPPSDAAIMQQAFSDSQFTVGIAGPILDGLIVAITAKHLTPRDLRALDAVVRWLKVDRKNPAAGVQWIVRARRLMTQLVGIKTSGGTDPPMTRTPDNFFGQGKDGTADGGILCGEAFFKHGPHCRRDVITHECLHFLGVHHGGQPLDGPDDPRLIKTSAQALDDANSLAQLVAQLTTRGGKTGACERPHE